MKKNLILFILMFTMLGVSAQQYRDWSKWSIAIEGGVNRFDGDVKQDYGRTVIATSDLNLTFGGLIEFTPSPAWSLGLDYYYIPLSAAHPQGTYSFETKMHNVSLFYAVNALKLFFPRTTTKWGIWGGAGLGISLHDVNYQTINGKNLPAGQKYQYVTGPQGVQYADYDYTNPDGRAMFVPLHLLFEYNLSKSFALGLKGQFRGYFVDDIDGRMRPNANDALQMATLQLRYKFNAINKDHTRNINKAQFAGLVTMDDLDNLQRQIDGIIIPADPTDRLNNLDNRLQKLENYLDIDGPDDDKDGVANSRDQEPNTPAGNQVDFWGRTIPKGGESLDPSAFIFFDFDKVDLNEEALNAVSIAASKLQADPALLVEVRGFTDNMGSDEYNAGLSQRRADRVKDELVKAYGIDANRIIANGKGKYNPSDVATKYRPYRTAIFFYSK